MQDKTSEIKFQRKMSSEYTLERVESIINKGYKNFDLYFKTFSEFIDKNDVIVDAMCGPAFFSFLLYRKGFRNITCFDISAEVINTARALFRKHRFDRARILVSDVEKIKLPDKYADLVFVTTSLHHLPDMSEAAMEIKRILKDGGHFVAFEPNALNPYSLYHHIEEKNRGYASKNEKLPTPEGIKKVFISAGFSDVKVHTFRFLPNICGLGESTDRIISKIPLLNRLGSKIVLICKK